MTQAELDRAVARATHETVTTVRHLGFSELTPELEDADVQVIDWDALHAQRNLLAAGL